MKGFLLVLLCVLCLGCGGGGGGRSATDPSDLEGNWSGTFTLTFAETGTVSGSLMRIKGGEPDLYRFEGDLVETTRPATGDMSLTFDESGNFLGASIKFGTDPAIVGPGGDISLSNGNNTLSGSATLGGQGVLVVNLTRQ